ncbi:MAG: class I SAM-dependent methyltransferase, partial [Candidatus ainarchaeum sp.]|nr:class I SAM-dependent methyltransferase [Candidatus ainarchaeum sp.]
KKSKTTLLTGSKIYESSFDESKGILLWEQLMKESPYSLRQFTIKQIKEKLKDNNQIIDIGCGGGIGLEEILLTSNEPFDLFGLEVSKNYLEKAKNKIQHLQNKLTDQKLTNAKNTKFLVKNISDGPLNKKFDAIFISLVVNHIYEKDRKKFFQNLKKMMKPDATLVTFQFVNQSKFERSPMWVMHNIPSHKDFPYKNTFITMLKKVFPIVDVKFNGTIIVCKLTK